MVLKTHVLMCIQGYPCRETCVEVHKACAKELLVFQEFNVCGFYPLQGDDPTCFRPEVTCPEPCAPTHGSVTFSDVTIWSEAVYECGFLFYLEGDRTRTCQVCLYFSSNSADLAPSSQNEVPYLHVKSRLI